MTTEEFEQFVVNSARMGIADLAYSVVGLAGECGEVSEWYKKAVCRKSKKYTQEMLKLELGDVVHYVARIGAYFGWSLSDIMAANVEKLEKRQNDKHDRADYGVVDANRSIQRDSVPEEYDRDTR